MHENRGFHFWTESLGQLKRLVESVEAAPPITLEDALEAAFCQNPQAVCVRSGIAADTRALLSEFGDYAIAAGHRLIRIDCGRRFQLPLYVARELIKQICASHPANKALLENKYKDISAEFKHRLYKLKADDHLSLSDREFLAYTRVDEKIPEEATIGLIARLVDFTLEAAFSRGALLIITIDGTRCLDTWSLSFLAHLVRRINKSSVFLCVIADSGLSSVARKIDFILGRDKSNGSVIKLQSRTDNGDRKSKRLISPDNFTAVEQYVLASLSVFALPATLDELTQMIEPRTDPSSLDEILKRLVSAGIVEECRRADIFEYSLADPRLKEAMYRSIPIAGRSIYHLGAAAAYKRSVSRYSDWDWQLDGRINDIYFHLLKGNDWQSALEYHNVFYSSNANTYLLHVKSNLEQLRSITTCETALGRAVKEHLEYQLASDTVRQPSVDTEYKIRACRRYLSRGKDVYNRAHVLANLSVLHCNRRTESAYAEALACCEAAYQESNGITDPDLRNYITAIIHNSRALLHFRKGEASQAIELEETALRLTQEAGPVRNRQIISASAILRSLTQIYGALVGSHSSAEELCMRSLEEARSRNDTEKVTECLMVLGKSMFKAGDYDRAMSYFLEAMGVAQGQPRLFTAQMYLYKALGLCYRNLDKPNESNESFRACLDYAITAGDYSEVASIVAALGRNYLKLGRLDDAIRQYSQAVRICAQCGFKRLEALYSAHLGDAYASAEDFKRAGKCFETAAKLFYESNALSQAIKCSTAALRCHTAAEVACERNFLRRLNSAIELASNPIDRHLLDDFRAAYSAHLPILN